MHGEAQKGGSRSGYVQALKHHLRSPGPQALRASHAAGTHEAARCGVRKPRIEFRLTSDAVSLNVVRFFAEAPFKFSLDFA